jgi:integrase
MIQLLILTGVRRNEIAESTWSEFDLGRAKWRIPAARSKNGREHNVPLSPQAMTILRELPRLKA